MPNTTEEKLEGAKSIKEQLVKAQEINKHIGCGGQHVDDTAKKLTETQAEIDQLEKQLNQMG